MQNRHSAGMCLLQEAAQNDPNDPYAAYNQAVILEAFGVYTEARDLYQTAEAHPDFQKGRWDDGAARTNRRIKHLKLMAKAYDMVAEPTAFASGSLSGRGPHRRARDREAHHAL